MKYVTKMPILSIKKAVFEVKMALDDFCACKIVLWKQSVGSRRFVPGES